MNFLSPSTYNSAGLVHSAQPLDIVTQHEHPTEVVRGWIGADQYDEKLSAADNIVRAVTNGTFSTAYSITFKEIVFDFGKHEQILFPENVMLDACQVRSGQVAFHHGTADAIGRDASVVACGADATANAAVEGASTYATAPGATVNATAKGAMAVARALGATANATMAGSRAYAWVSGATANATTNGADAYAKASGATANATANAAYAYAEASGGTANAVGFGADAYAKASGATANATTNGARAYAEASGATANATAKGAVARARALRSIAVARHALTSLSVKQGKALCFEEFRIISGDGDKFWDRNKTDHERAEAGYTVGMAFCDGKGVKQSDSLATFFLSAAHELGHLRAAFELGELYSKKRASIRRDQNLANHWYSKETPTAKTIRELAPKYALMLAGLDDNKSTLHNSPKDVITVIGSFLGKL